MRYTPFAYIKGSLNDLTPPGPIDTGSNMLMFYDFTNQLSYPTSGSLVYNFISGSAWNNTLTLGSGSGYYTNGWTHFNYGEENYNGINQYGFAYYGSGGDSFDWSIGGWFKATSDDGVLFARGGGYGTYPGYSIVIQKNADGKLQLDIIGSRDRFNNIGTYGATVYGHTILEPGQWYYVMGIWKKGEQGRLYLNGNLEGMSVITWGLLFGGSSFSQGMLQTSTYAQSYYSGSFGDYEIYGSAVSGSLVMGNFSARTGSYATSYHPNSEIGINTQMLVGGYNTGSLRVYVDRGSGFNLEYTLTNNNPTVLNSENTIYGSTLSLLPGNRFYATVDDYGFTPTDFANITVYKNLGIVEAISGSLNVTSSVYTVSTGDAFTLNPSAGYARR